MKLKNHEIIETGDGTKSVYSKTYNENAHSLDGAGEETLTHYIEGCEVEKKTKEHSPTFILEVGFGAGVGFLKTFESFKEENIKMYSLEIDPELVPLFNEMNKEYLLTEISDNHFQFTYKQFELNLIIGNARESIKTIDKKFHAIYQDAYSLRRNPILWTVEWFNDLKEISTPDVIMSTYSASSTVRKSMLEAGFSIYHGVKFGNKKTSTRACLNKQSDQDIIEHLNRSPVNPLRDIDCEAHS